VHFTGHLHDRQALADLVARSDVALAPCPVESFGLSVLEALAVGTPVVVADAGASVELIDEGCGRAAAPHPASMADAVMAVLEQPSRRAAARARAEQYPWSHTLEAMLDAHLLPGAPLEAVR
jgi:alpha-1,6-mannosyltransferase